MLRQLRVVILIVHFQNSIYIDDLRFLMAKTVIHSHLMLYFYCIGFTVSEEGIRVLDEYMQRMTRATSKGQFVLN